ncbi:MAG TPA: hypothetical protein P5184_06365, partial [Bacteroidales bacterium]|nr:hypothetical protein [Bacteroidales bacterium]
DKTPGESVRKKIHANRRSNIGTNADYLRITLTGFQDALPKPCFGCPVSLVEISFHWIPLYPGVYIPGYQHGVPMERDVLINFCSLATDMAFRWNAFVLINFYFFLFFAL